VGVDLAAEATRTAVAQLDWTAGDATVLSVVLGADDGAVIAAVSGADKAGIDCPFGWPESFVDFVSTHRVGNVFVPIDIAGRDWRRRLAYRGTDLQVHAVTGIWPLSVAADRISHTAMRCAGLLATLAQQGQPVDRTGTGIVVEVYPAASLATWKLRRAADLDESPGSSRKVILIILRSRPSDLSAGAGQERRPADAGRGPESGVSQGRATGDRSRRGGSSRLTPETTLPTERPQRCNARQDRRG
jgi:predicted nuclease with RNAse H fold